MKHIRPVITIDELLKKLRAAFRRNGREKGGLLALRGGEIVGFFLDAGGKRYPGACALSIPPLIRRPEGWHRKAGRPALSAAAGAESPSAPGICGMRKNSFP